MKLHHSALPSLKALIAKSRFLLSRPPRFPLHSIRNLPCLLSLMLLVSCQGARIQKAVPIIRDHWVKVSEHPPTFHARGCDANADTSFNYGEWFEIGDAQGSRFFIPFKVAGNLPRPILVKEVMAARSEKEQREVNVKIRQMETKNAGLFLLGAPVWSTYIAALATAGAGR